jgi:hypothetical protein
LRFSWACYVLLAFEGDGTTCDGIISVITLEAQTFHSFTAFSEHILDNSHINRFYIFAPYNASNSSMLVTVTISASGDLSDR